MKNKKKKQKPRKHYLAAIIFTGIVVIVLWIVVASIMNKKLVNLEWYHEEMHLEAAWKKSKGEGITIAILDTGISDESYEKFDDRIIDPYNVLTESDDVTDLNGHGTSIAVIIGADYKSFGIYGVAPKANIMPVVVADGSGRTTAEKVAEGIYYAVNKGADIINISLGARLFNQMVEDATLYAFEQGVLVIASAGENNSDELHYPASFDHVLAVSAQSMLGRLYMDTNYNEKSVVIPGEYIKTLSVHHETKADFIIYRSGSSFSTAIMSGLAALKLNQADVSPDAFMALMAELNHEKLEDTFFDSRWIL